ncbi:hypothetical protein EDD86DRAFT_277896 [Gorgonomyces haynaldii]|nr:hypothetical protein EDD86DRAFT_277896 [Gorgonomyces haynaldii]
MLNLTDLPIEIIQLILLRLHVKDYLSFTSTNRRYSQMHSKFYWKRQPMPYTFHQAVKRNQIYLVDLLLRILDDLKLQQSVVRLAAEKGHLEILHKLLKTDKISGVFDDALQFACLEGHFSIVQTLLRDNRVDPASNRNIAIQWAAEKGHTQIVKLMLKDHRVDPSDRNDLAIRYAVMFEHHETANLLIKDPRVDPSCANNNCIKTAYSNRDYLMLKILLKHPKVDQSYRKYLRRNKIFGKLMKIWRAIEKLFSFHFDDLRVN